MKMGNLPSVMNHSFSQVPKAEIPRSSFNRSSGFKTTMDAGVLVPVFVDEALPGDTFNLNMTVFARLATPSPRSWTTCISIRSSSAYPTV